GGQSGGQGQSRGQSSNSSSNRSNQKMIPAVSIERCIGCGACEYVCPAAPFSAIYVEGKNRHTEI
ncbi:MAG: 4Fe-4S binding protein, partial [Rikenellaceae bacterium]